MNLRNYDSWRLASPPRYDDEPEREPEMVEVAHTPGPWFVKYNPVRLAVLDSDGGYVAEDIRAADPDEREANARLIAAAPSINNALRDILAVFVRMGSVENPPTMDEVVRVREQAEKVIAEVDAKS